MDICLILILLLFLIKWELERFYKEELQRIIKKFNVGSRHLYPSLVDETRVNKIKFTLKYERDMINVCHVDSRIGGNEMPRTFKGVFRHEVFYGVHNTITNTE